MNARTGSIKNPMSKEEAAVLAQSIFIPNNTVKNVAYIITEHNHSDDMAMFTYQCPMKCEGDKTYTEAGTYPTCKINLKKVEATNDTNKAK